MKKIILALSLVMTVGWTKALAAEKTDVDPRVLAAFKKEFSFAKDVKWGEDNGFITARFSINDQGLLAYFNEDAELVAVTRSILYKELPLSVIRRLGDRFADAAVYEVVEVKKGKETRYFMKAEKNGKKFLLKAYPSGNLTVVKKLDK